MTEEKLVKVGMVSQVVKDYFKANPSIIEVMAKDLMPVFVEKGIFKKDHRNGLPIRDLLRELDAENKLYLIENIKVVRNTINRNWYFKRINN